MIIEHIYDDIKKALLQKEYTEVQMLRYIVACCLKKNEDLSDERVLSVLVSLRDTYVSAKKVCVAHGGDGEQYETNIALLERYLPEQISDDRLVKAMEELRERGIIGQKVIGVMKKQFPYVSGQHIKGVYEQTYER